MQIKENKVAILSGDGIGPEVMPEALKVLDVIAAKSKRRFIYLECLVGGTSIDVEGTPITAKTLEVCKSADAVLLGAVGDERWDSLPLSKRPEVALLEIRRSLECFANLRPIWLPQCIAETTPIRSELVASGVDILIVRELVHGLYFGPRGRRTNEKGKVEAFDTAVYSESAVRQVAEIAFKMASNRRCRIISMDKSNILETSRLWREVTEAVSVNFPEVELNHQLIDSGSMMLLCNPSEYDVVLLNNEYGDIISDEASLLAGSLGMMPSAALGVKHPFLYEPVHGSAPDIAGKGIANPIACILSAAMMLEYSFDMRAEARAVWAAVEQTLEAGCRTRDIAESGKGSASTVEMGEAIADAVESIL